MVPLQLRLAPDWMICCPSLWTDYRFGCVNGRLTARQGEMPLRRFFSRDAPQVPRIRWTQAPLEIGQKPHARAHWDSWRTNNSRKTRGPGLRALLLPLNSAMTRSKRKFPANGKKSTRRPPNSVPSASPRKRPIVQPALRRPRKRSRSAFDQRSESER